MLPVKLELTILYSLFHRLIPINSWSINKKPNYGSKMTFTHIVPVVPDINTRSECLKIAQALKANCASAM
jgi:hypothetical protein